MKKRTRLPKGSISTTRAVNVLLQRAITFERHARKLRDMAHRIVVTFENPITPRRARLLAAQMDQLERGDWTDPRIAYHTLIDALKLVAVKEYARPMKVPTPNRSVIHE